MQHSSVSTKNVLSVLQTDSTYAPHLISTKEYIDLVQAKSPEEVIIAIKQLGVLAKQEKRITEIAEDIEERISIIRHKLKFIDITQRPKVLCLSDFSPPAILQNTFIESLITIAGGQAYSSWESSASFNPDIIILISNAQLSLLFNELPNLLNSSTWSNTTAVKNNRIYIIHEIQNMDIPDIDVADNIETLAEIINPQHFIFGKNGKSWMQFDWTA